MVHPGVEFVRELFADPEWDRGTVLERRAAMDAMTGDVPAPPGVTVEPLVLGGRPAERLTPAGGTVDATVLLLHGGGYCLGGLHSHRDLAGQLALAASTPVVTLDYRLAPEHPFPAALDDALRAYRQLVADDPTRPVAIVGDSAGGGLALATAIARRDRGEPLPAALACLSPWTDLTQTADSFRRNATADPTVTKEGLDLLAEAYLAGTGTDARHPLVSPRFADLTGLPPLRIDVGGHEVLLDDAVEVAASARAAGVTVDLQVWPELFHVFQAYPAEIVPETEPSLAAIAAFVVGHLVAARP